MDFSWIYTSWTAALMVIISTVAIYVSLIILTRLAGLRSFSKMSSFDFAVTVAIGSVIASTILTRNPPLLQAAVGLSSLYCVQILVAWLRGRSQAFNRMVNNKPLLLMKGSTIVEENLKKAQVTHADLRAKLREANVIRLSQVKAVVMEATGDISVLHSEDENSEPDDELLKNVRGWN